jgi:hypothetical protein
MKLPRPKNKAFRFFVGALLIIASLVIGNAVALTIIGLLLAGILPLTWSPVVYVILGAVAKFVDIIIDFLITTKFLRENHPLRTLKHKKCHQALREMGSREGEMIMAIPYEDWAVILSNLSPETAKHVKTRLKAMEPVLEFLGKKDGPKT